MNSRKNRSPSKVVPILPGTGIIRSGGFKGKLESWRSKLSGTGNFYLLKKIRSLVIRKGLLREAQRWAEAPHASSGQRCRHSSLSSPSPQARGAHKALGGSKRVSFGFRIVPYPDLKKWWVGTGTYRYYLGFMKKSITNFLWNSNLKLQQF